MPSVAAPLIGGIVGYSTSQTINAVISDPRNALAILINPVIGLPFVQARATLAGFRRPDEPEQFQELARGALVNTASSVDPLPVVYGSRRKGGTRVLTEVTGSQNEFLHIVIALAEGEISAINTVYLDDVATTDSRFSGLVTVEKYVGTDTQAASAALIAALGSAKWSSAHQGKGVAYVYVKLQWSQDAFPRGLPTITADVDGKLVYDPRDGNTAFSNNPALCIRDYLANSRYGRGIASASLDEQSFKDAANHNDDLVTTPTGTQARYTCDGVLDPDAGWLENLKALLTSCRGYILFTGGKYKLKIDRSHWALNFPNQSSQGVTGSLPSTAAGADITVEAWIKPNTVAGIRTVLSKGRSGVSFGYGIVLTGGALHGRNSTNDHLIASGVITAGVTQHVAIVYTPSGMTGYVDGVSVGSNAQTTTSDTTNVFALGVRAENEQTSELFDGLIKDVRVYERALSAAEIAEHHRGIYRDEGQLALRLDCDEGEKSTAYDWSGNGRNAAIPSNVAYTSQLPPWMESNAFTEDNIVGGWEIRNAGKREKANRVRARFFNSGRSWQPDIAVWDDTAHRTQDNELVLEREIELPFTENFHRAQRIAQLEEKVSRFGITASFRATIAALQTEVGDVCVITHSTPGWTEKPFRIVGMQPLANGEVQMTVIEYQNIAYSLSELDSEPAVPATNLPSIFTNLTISGLTLASGTDHLFRAADGTIHSRIKAVWNAVSNPFLASYELQFMVVSGSPNFWQNAPDVKTAAEGYCVPVDDGKTYYVRVRARTVAGNAGAWSPSDTGLAHTVTGKTAAPSDVSGFSATQSGATVIFNVDHITDPDLDRVEIRWADSGNITWDDAQALTNILRGKTSTSAAVPPGTWTFLAKAFDTSGNKSSGTARADLTVTADGFTDISATEYAPKWLGHLSNMVEHWTGVLVPDSQSLAADLGWEVFDQFVPNAYQHCYFEPHSPIDKGIDAPARIYADLVSVLGPGETSGQAAPDFQVDHRLSTTSFDGYENWSVGTATFRYMQGRIHVDTTIGKPVISGFEINLDAETREEQFLNQAIGSGGTAITYATPFHSAPAVQITPLGTTALIPSAENKTATGFTAHLYNTSGAGAAGNADIIVTGA